MSTLHQPHHEDLLPSYCLGALEGEELDGLRRHLETGCPECERLLGEWQQALERIATSVEPVEPSETTRARLLRALPAASAEPTAGRPAGRADRGGLIRLLVVAASVVALLLAGTSLLRQRQLEHQIEGLRAERAQLERRLALLDSQLLETRDDLAHLGNALRFVNAPHTSSVVLAGLGPATRASASAYLRPLAGRAIVYAYDLPPLGEERSYQLWYIIDQGPVSGGIFTVDEAGAAVVEVADLPEVGSIRQWAVTIEPAGGVPQPTGVMVLAS